MTTMTFNTFKKYGKEMQQIALAVFLGIETGLQYNLSLK